MNDTPCKVLEINGVRYVPETAAGPLAGKVDRAERLLVNSVIDTNIDTGCVLRSLIEEIRNDLGLPKPGEAAK